MPFDVTQKTLERLDWTDIQARLEALALTPIARERLRAGSIFQPSATDVRLRLAETREARALLGEGLSPPLDALRPQQESLSRLHKGGTLIPSELLDLCATLTASRVTRSSVAARKEAAPRLAEIVEHLGITRSWKSVFKPASTTLERSAMPRRAV